jgi:hypothetical protein
MPIFTAPYPCLSTIKSRLSQYDGSVPEGVINVKYLKDFLVKKNLPFIVSLSEDCTAIVSKREYGTAFNSDMCIILPMEPNGLRNHNRTVVRDIKSIMDV